MIKTKFKLNVIIGYIFLINFTNQTKAIKLQKYSQYENKMVSGLLEANLRVFDTFEVRSSNPSIACMAACNMNCNCALVSLNSSYFCTMFSNQTLLVNLEDSTVSNMYSKDAIKQCFEGFYYLGKNNTCQPKKAINQTCMELVECKQNIGLDCLNGLCQCSNSDFKFISFSCSNI